MSHGLMTTMLDPNRVEEIFARALALATPQERAALLESACAGDEALRARVEQLLAAHTKDCNCLPLPASPDQPDATGLAESAGLQIGRYKLLQQIGEGGFGVVFMAEQTAPVRRRVALKIIKLGMDTRQVVARFEAERQALAMMDHPNVARVLDAGATETGRPYFVMELVRGEPITAYCDAHHLDVRQRLELFAQVCQAVQHAHQKGIIHRDLKPNNVLISMQDDRPVAKVIDFGIAKATQAPLTERTLFTEFRQWIGTPQYMSPEQADGLLDVDTRSDVYALGVLLYELLTGATPFDGKALRENAYDEVRRIIREVEPPPPSTRLSRLGDTLPNVAAARQTDAGTLQTVVRGELDWIVMRCLEKDRSRRYESPSALAADVARFLADEPVSAAAPSRGYRLRKFARRNRVPLTAAAVVAVALAVATVVSLRQAIRATRAEQQALANEQRAVTSARQAEAVSNFLVSAFRSPDPTRQARSITIAEVLDRSRRDLDGKFADDPHTKAAMLHAIADASVNLGLSAEAVGPFEEALRLRTDALGERHVDTLETMGALAAAYTAVGRTEAVRLAQKAQRLRFETMGADHPDTLRSTLTLANAYAGAKRNAEAVPLARKALELYRAKFGDDAHETLDCMNEVGAILGNAGASGDAALFITSAEQLRIKLGPDHPDTLSAVNNLGLHYWYNNRRDESVRLWKDALARGQNVLGPQHPITRRSRGHLLLALQEQGTTDRELLKIFQPLTTQPATRPAHLVTRGQIRAGLGDIAGATEDFVTAIPQLEDLSHTMSPRKNASRVAAPMPELFDALTKALPDETTLWVSRADYYAWREQWELARRDYERVLPARGLHDERFAYAGVLLLLGDEQAYEKFCRDTVDQFADPPDEYSNYVLATICVAGPAKSVGTQRILRWAERGIGPREAWKLETLGLAQLNARDPERAVETFEELRRRWPLAEEYGFAAALAHHAVGQVEAAQENFRRGMALFERSKPSKPGQPASVSPPSRWVQLLLYSRRAQAALARPATAPTPTKP